MTAKKAIREEETLGDGGGMTAKEILLGQIQLLLPITGIAVIVTTISALVFDVGTIPISRIVLLIPLILICLAGLSIFYSKKALTKAGLFARYVIHFALTITCATWLMVYEGWISLEFSYLVITVPMHIASYILVGVIDEVNSRRVTSKLNQDLEEFHKRCQSRG